MLLLSIDIKLCKAQLSKIIQSRGFLGALIENYAGPLMKVTVPLVKNVLAPLATMASGFAIDDVVQRKMHGGGVIATSGVGVIRAGKSIT